LIVLNKPKKIDKKTEGSRWPYQWPTGIGVDVEERNKKEIEKEW